MNERCGKCGGAMKEGFLVDISQRISRISHWAEGAPEFWFLDILRMRGRRRLAVRSFRCSKCGFLESYAPEASHR